jgi:hypothetical protein
MFHKVSLETMDRIERSGGLIRGVDPRVEFIPNSPSVTGLTSALHRFDRCRPLWVFGSGEQLDLLVVAARFLGLVLGKNRVGLPRFVVLLVFLGSCF